jgi:acyl phosphate:glycerol-3-phosphate acyltransferase
VTPEQPALGVAIVAIALVAGYAVGSIPLARLLARAAGVDPLLAGDGNPGAANVWHLAGPGWGMLALSGDLAKGVVPVSLAIVTWSWNLGWFAALGAVAGASWPLLGRLPGGRGVAVFSGAAFALAPPAGTVSVLLTLAVVGAGRLVRRNLRVAAIAAGVGSYPVLFLAAQQDVVRLCALLVLYLVALVRYLSTARR